MYLLSQKITGFHPRPDQSVTKQCGLINKTESESISLAVFLPLVLPPQVYIQDSTWIFF